MIKTLKKIKNLFINAIFIYKLLWKEHKAYFFQSFLLIIVNAVSPFIVIIMPRFIINELMQGKRFVVVIEYVIVMFAISFILSNLQAFLQNYTLYSAKYLMVPLSIIFNQKNMEMDYENTEDPEILDEKEKAQSMVINGGCTDNYLLAINELIANLIRISGLSYILSSISIYVLIMIILVSILNTWYSLRIQRKNFDLNTKVMPITRMGNYLKGLGRNDSFGKTIRVYQLSDWFMKKALDNRKEYVVFRNKMIRNNNIKDVVGILTGIFQQLLIYIFLLYKLIKDNMLVGDFVMYTNSISQFPSVFNSISGSYINIKNYGQYITQYRSFIERPNNLRLTRKGDVRLLSGLHTIEFQHVYFKYPKTEKYILEDICITIKPGEKLSVIGENGAGKSTFIKVLLRLYDVTEGAILLDGINIKEYDYKEYMDIIATVFQDYKIFSFSVLENIALSKTNEAQEEELNRVIEIGGIDNKISTLKNGIHTHLSRQFEEDGITLSGGEQQKIVLCRALFKNASLVILDEPTSSLSPLAEYDIYKRFNQMVEHKTAIFVSHRLSSSQFCDNIAFFHHGKIVEYGPHKELMELGGRYAEMFQLQASYYATEEVV